ncbi:MAG: hypothetical protein LBJ10_05755, partial [Clostridiales bacterium]|nr:hypothetical protein [Clostridiales bacterium]
EPSRRRVENGFLAPHGSPPECMYAIRLPRPDGIERSLSFRCFRRNAGFLLPPKASLLPFLYFFQSRAGEQLPARLHIYNRHVNTGHISPFDPDCPDKKTAAAIRAIL